MIKEVQDRVMELSEVESYDFSEKMKKSHWNYAKKSKKEGFFISFL